MPRFLPLALFAVAATAHAVPSANLAPGAGCEAFTDPREVRFRVPDRVVTGQIVGGSISEPDAGNPDLGQQLVIGSATLASVDGGPPIKVSYYYWNTVGGCGGWGPGRGGRFVFDLVDDRTPDGALRVMRYAAAAR